MIRWQAMKKSARCLKCGHRRLLVIDKVMQPVHESSYAIRSLNVTSCELTMPSPEERESPRLDVGWFEVIICTNCGYTEWYANLALDDLKRLLREPNSGVRLVDGEPRENGPYR